MLDTVNYNDFNADLVKDGYVLEVVDIYGKRICLEYTKEEYEEGYSYAQYNSTFDTVDYTLLYSPDSEESLLFEDGILVKRTN